CAVMSDGTLTCQLDTPDFAAQSGQAQTVAVGSRMYCALDPQGAVFCRSFPSLASTPPDWDIPAGGLAALTDVKELVGAEVGICARTGSGGVWCWGVGQVAPASGVPGTLQRVLGLGGPVTALAGGLHDVCALREDGKVFCWQISGNTLESLTPGRMPF